jgi:hypothetical protein
MRLEEDVILPLAERTLTEADWAPIDAAPAPVGLGPNR